MGIHKGISSAMIGSVAWMHLVGAQAGQERPNIIFLLSDDQSWNHLGINGNEIIRTPHIDDMARNGVNFPYSFVTTSICVSSRVSILTGQYMRTHGIRDFNRAMTPEQMAMTYPGLLRRNGYFTGFTGKWGIAAEIYNYDMYADEFDFWRGKNEQDEFWLDGREGRHQNVRMSDDAEDFIVQAKASGKPFCLSISFKAPHGPWDQYEPEFFDRIRQSDMPIPSTFNQEAWNRQPAFIQDGIMGVQGKIARDFMWGANPTVSHHQRLVRMYYALIEGMDASIGRIRESLERHGVADNTILIFFSDNGHFIHEHGLYGKWLMYEPSIRVPLVVYDPRLPDSARGQTRDEMALSVDLAPTMLSMAGVEIPDGMQGADLSPLLRGEAVDWRTDWFYEHTYSEAWTRRIPKSIGVRGERWKYIRTISERPVYEQLFDLENDYDELNNLADCPGHREILETMRARCDEWREKLTDNYPDYHEYVDDYVVVGTHYLKADKPVQFAGVRSLGQTFLAETDHLTCVEFILPTWGRGEGPCDVKAELLQGGRVLRTLVIDKDDIENTRIQRLMFDTPVQKGKSLYLRLSPTGPVPPQRMAWWAYDHPFYPNGTAYVDDQPRFYNHELRMVFRKTR